MPTLAEQARERTAAAKEKIAAELAQEIHEETGKAIAAIEKAADAGHNVTGCDVTRASGKDVVRNLERHGFRVNYDYYSSGCRLTIHW